MRQLIIRRILVALAFWAAAGGAQAASSGNDFLSAEIPARAAGMGGAFVAANDDATAFQWNPSALSGIRQPMVSATHYNALADSNFELATFVQPVAPLIPGALGMGVQYSTTGNFYQTDAQGQNLGLIENYDILVQAAYGLPVTDRLGLGFGVKAFSSRLQDYLSRGGAADFGLQAHVTEALCLGLSFMNLGSQTAYDVVADPLPTVLKIGVQDQVLDMPDSSLALAGELDRPWTSEDPVTTRLGGEYWYGHRLALRLGYRFGEDLGNLTLGAGIKAWGVDLDYAYVPFSDLGQTHRLTFGAELGTLMKAVVPGPSARLETKPGGAQAQPEAHAFMPWDRGTRVSGPVDRNTMWTRKQSPYLVVADVTVAKGVTLTIEAGVEVRFAASAEASRPLQPVGFEGQTPQNDLIVKGLLTAQGRPDAPISLVGEGGASWGAVIFVAGCDNNSRMEYCQVEGGRVVFSAASPSLTHSHLVRSGVEVGFLSSPELSYNRIEGGEAGIVSLSGSSDLSKVGNNLITGNRYGLYLRGFADAGMRRNTFNENLEFDVINYTSKPADLSGNFWGGRGEDAVRKSIYDKQSNPASGPVIIAPAAQ